MLDLPSKCKAQEVARLGPRRRSCSSGDLFEQREENGGFLGGFLDLFGAELGELDVVRFLAILEQSVVEATPLLR